MKIYIHPLTHSYSTDDPRLPANSTLVHIGGQDNENLLLYLEPINSPRIHERIGTEKVIKQYTNLLVTKGTRFRSADGSKIGGRYIVTNEKGEHIGAINYTTINRKTSISNIYVRPDYRRKGIATQLVNAIKQDYPRIMVDSNMTNAGSKFFGYARNISESGLIKLPPKLLQDALKMVHSKVLSYAYESTDGKSDYSEVNSMLLRLAKERNIKMVNINEAVMPTELNIDVSGLPQDYYKFAGFGSNILIGLDAITTRSTAYFSKPNKIYICIASLNRMLFHKYTPSYKVLEDYFDQLDGLVEHELTHYIQHTLLHKANTKRNKLNDGRDNNELSEEEVKRKNIEYYKSPVEFDPQIKSAVADFVLAVKKNGIFDYLERVQVSALIAYYTGAKGLAETMDYVHPVFNPNEFFVTLSKHKPIAWKRAVRIFATAINAIFDVRKRS